MSKIDFRNFSLSTKVDRERTSVSQLSMERTTVSERRSVVATVVIVLFFG